MIALRVDVGKIVWNKFGVMVSTVQSERNLQEGCGSEKKIEVSCLLIIPKTYRRTSMCLYRSVLLREAALKSVFQMTSLASV